jgi:hypothetical protein
MRLGPTAEPVVSLASSSSSVASAAEVGASVVAPASRDEAAGGASSFGALLEGLGREVHRGESLVRSAVGAARGGVAIGPAELIALQAGVYRYGEAVDLASRLIDRATSAVKTVLQGQ